MVIQKVSVARQLNLQQPVINANAQQCHQRHYFGRSRYFDIIITGNGRLDAHRHDFHTALHLIFRSRRAASLFFHRSATRLFHRLSHAAHLHFHRFRHAARHRSPTIQHLKDTQLPRPRHIAMYQRRTAPHDDQHQKECNHNKDLSNSSNHSSLKTLFIKIFRCKDRDNLPNLQILRQKKT